jgi:hypothetical protein
MQESIIIGAEGVVIMASEEDSRNARREALLAMHAQTGEAQKQVQKPPEIKPPLDLASLRPMVRTTVTSEERKAQQVVDATWKLFQNALG